MLSQADDERLARSVMNTARIKFSDETFNHMAYAVAIDKELRWLCTENVISMKRMYDINMVVAKLFEAELNAYVHNY